MFKFVVLACLIFVSIQARSYESFNSFEEALEYEKSKYDFDAHLKVDLTHFKNFKVTHNKNYDSVQEELKRFNIFRVNLLKIKLLNALDYGTAFYGVNHFADLDENEFKQKYTGLRMDRTQTEKSVEYSEPEFDANAELPNEVDWRQKGVVTEIKNQGMCGSCWAFSAVGAVESQNAIVNHKLVSLSEQEMVDCDTQSQGCNGGWMTWGFDALKKLGGLETQKDYPYSQHSGKCKFNKSLSVVEVESYVNLTKNEDDIAKYVSQKGPVSIAINANLMQFYMGGISHPTSFLSKFLCNPNLVNHGVLIVGFGETTRRGKREPYWIIKNSWSENWGRHGYYYLYRGGNCCGVSEYVSAPIVKKK